MFYKDLYDNHNSQYSTEISGKKHKCFISGKMDKLFVFVSYQEGKRMDRL